MCGGRSARRRPTCRSSSCPATRWWRSRSAPGMKASLSASRSPSRRSSSRRRCAARWRGKPTRTERVPRLVLVTDRHAAEGRDLLAVIAAALDAGLPAVQLRDRDLPGRPLRLLGAGALIGVSTHAPGEVPADADLAFFGPVWATPFKTGAQGAARLAQAVRAAAVPVLAIGGVTAARVPEVRAAGAAGAAVIRAILAAPDPAA